MLKRKFALMFALVTAIAGLGVASAFADNPPAPHATTGVTASPNGSGQQEQEGVDEDGAANNVATAATDVENEADNQSADDESGDDQGDNNDDQGDNDQGDGNDD